MVGDIAHVCNRGVDKRKIFNDNNDYLRFRDNLFLLNNTGGKIRTKHKNIFDNSTKLSDRHKLVEIFKWSLMPNHFHLLLYEQIEGGIVEFIKRVGNAYTKYFNLRNNGRQGYLFQDHAKIISIQNEKHFPYIPIYIDLNASDLISENDIKKLTFLKSYRWSSLKNYYGNEEDSGIINQKLFYEIFETSPTRYGEDIEGFLKDRRKLEIELQGVNPTG